MIHDLATLNDMETAEELVDPAEELREQWLEQRSGIFTASKFGDLLGKGRNHSFTVKGLDYLRLKLAERLGSWHSFDSKSMQWGRNNEEKAISEYAVATNQLVGAEPYRLFKFNDYVGGTPDGLVGEDGVVEVKCPFNPSVHINTLLTRKVPAEYVWQVHGEMLVTKRKWCDFVSFDPRIEGDHRLVIIRVDRDELKIKCMIERFKEAEDLLQSWMKEIGAAA